MSDNKNTVITVVFNFFLQVCQDEVETLNFCLSLHNQKISSFEIIVPQIFNLILSSLEFFLNTLDFRSFIGNISLDSGDGDGKTVDLVVDSCNLLTKGVNPCIEICYFLFQGCSFDDKGIQLFVVFSLQENKLGDDVCDHLICDCLTIQKILDILLLICRNSSRGSATTNINKPSILIESSLAPLACAAAIVYNAD